MVAALAAEERPEEQCVEACWKWLLPEAGEASWKCDAATRLWVVHCPDDDFSLAAARDRLTSRKCLDTRQWIGAEVRERWCTAAHTHVRRPAFGGDAGAVVCNDCVAELERPPVQPRWNRAADHVTMPKRAIANDLLGALPRTQSGGLPEWFCELSAGDRAFIARARCYNTVVTLRRGMNPRQQGQLGHSIAFPQAPEKLFAVLPSLPGDVADQLTFVQEAPRPYLGPATDGDAKRREHELAQRERREQELARKTLRSQAEWKVSPSRCREALLWL
eukprot:gene35526-25001_t